MRPELLHCIKKSKKKLVNQSFGYGFGSVMLMLTLYRYASRLDFLLYCILGLLVIAAAYHLFQYYTLAKDYHRISRKILEDAESIVWVYTYEKEVMPFGLVLYKKIDFCFALADGNTEVLTFLSDLKYLFLRLLKDHLPHATFGHSVEKEQLYRANPETLRL
jgi:hypothetical protein